MFLEEAPGSSWRLTEGQERRQEPSKAPMVLQADSAGLDSGGEGGGNRWSEMYPGRGADRCAGGTDLGAEGAGRTEGSYWN